MPFLTSKAPSSVSRAQRPTVAAAKKKAPRAFHTHSAAVPPAAPQYGYFATPAPPQSAQAPPPQAHVVHQRFFVRDGSGSAGRDTDAAVSHRHHDPLGSLLQSPGAGGMRCPSPDVASDDDALPPPLSLPPPMLCDGDYVVTFATPHVTAATQALDAMVRTASNDESSLRAAVAMLPPLRPDDVRASRHSFLVCATAQRLVATSESLAQLSRVAPLAAAVARVDASVAVTLAYATQSTIRHFIDSTAAALGGADLSGASSLSTLVDLNSLLALRPLAAACAAPVPVTPALPCAALRQSPPPPLVATHDIVNAAQAALQWQFPLSVAPLLPPPGDWPSGGGGGGCGGGGERRPPWELSLQHSGRGRSRSFAAAPPGGVLRRRPSSVPQRGVAPGPDVAAAPPSPAARDPRGANRAHHCVAAALLAAAWAAALPPSAAAAERSAVACAVRGAAGSALFARSVAVAQAVLVCVGPRGLALLRALEAVVAVALPPPGFAVLGGSQDSQRGMTVTPSLTQGSATPFTPSQATSAAI